MWQVKYHLQVGAGIELHYTYTYKNRFTQHLYPGYNTTLNLSTLCIRNHIQIISTLSRNYSFYPRKIIITCSHPLMTSTERAKITRLTSARSLFGRSTSEKVSGMPNRTQLMAATGQAPMLPMVENNAGGEPRTSWITRGYSRGWRGMSGLVIVLPRLIQCNRKCILFEEWFIQGGILSIDEDMYSPVDRSSGGDKLVYSSR